MAEPTPYDDTELFGEADLELPILKERIRAALIAMEHIGISDVQRSLFTSILTGAEPAQYKPRPSAAPTRTY